jgi:hypothetical protein
MKKLTIFLFCGLLTSRGVSQKVTATNFVGGINGSFNVTSYGALCNGVHNDTSAFQATIDAATVDNVYARVVIPSTGHACLISQLKATNLTNKFTISGDNGANQFIATISCSEEVAHTGVCLDITGSVNISIQNIRFQGGPKPPLAMIRMGKSTVSNSSFIHTENVTAYCYGKGYAVYNNGGEVWQSIGDNYEGCGTPVVLSAAARCGNVASPFAACPGSTVSMSEVEFFTPFFGSDAPVGGGGYGITFDEGVGGTIEDVAIFGGYGQTTNGSTAMFGDKGKGAVRGFKVYNFRDEPQGPINIAPFMKFSNQVNGLYVRSKFAPVAAPSSAPMQFGAIMSGDIDLEPADNNRFYPNMLVTCASSTALTIHDYTASGGGPVPNNCPGDIELFNGVILPNLSMHSSNGNEMLCSGTLPTITSGFNGGSIAANANGNCSFLVTIGSGSAGSTGTVNLAPPTGGYNCYATNYSRAATISETSNSGGSVTLTNYGTTYAATSWTNGDTIMISCFGR